MQKPEVIYEDVDILVLNKPSGITVNRSETTKEPTVQDWVENYLHIAAHPTSHKKDIFPLDEQVFSERSGIVHRLDKETSGIILIAKNLTAFTDMQKQFKDRVVKKTYLALAHGKLVPQQGEINVPVGRLPYNRLRFGVIAGGRESVTQYKVLKNYTNSKTKEMFSFIELYPKTGRTHQIRVHLKYLNHPIFGDELYAGRKTARQDRKQLPRVFLHASQVTFVHPRTKKEMHFESELSPELQALEIA